MRDDRVPDATSGEIDQIATRDTSRRRAQSRSRPPLQTAPDALTTVVGGHQNTRVDARHAAARTPPEGLLRVSARWTRNLCVFAAVFLSISGVLRSRRPYPQDHQIASRLAYFAEHKDEYNVLFFGSSRMWHGIVPKRFDAEMKKRGHRIRSYNLGVAAMQPHEANVLIDEVLAMKPANLEWVFVELDKWKPRIKEKHRFTERVIFWHTLNETWAACESTIAWRRGIAEKLSLLNTHLLHMGANYANIGQAARLTWPGTTPVCEHEPSSTIVVDEQGFEALEATKTKQRSRRARRKAFLQDIPGFELMISTIAEDNSRPVSLSRYNLRALDGQIERIRRSGAEPVYVIPARPKATPILYRLHEQGRVPLLFAFNDPDAFPDLYRIDRLYDVGHHNREGAEEFSSLLAERFALQLEAGEVE